VSEEGEEPLGELEAFVAELCGHDWAGFVAREFLEQGKVHVALVRRMGEVVARLEARDDAAVVAAGIEARIEGWWERIQQATRGFRFTPSVHPWHWRTRLDDGARRLRYAAARRSMPDACDCQLADAAGLPARPPARERLEEIARADDEDLPWPAPWTEYRCRDCGARWREDASSENWTASSWSRQRG
jgi:hypothetical protein